MAEKITKRKVIETTIFCYSLNRLGVYCIKTANLSFTQIVTNNPIVFDKIDTRKEYLNRINRYLKIGGWNRRKYEASEMKAYKRIILSSEEVKEEYPIDFYKYFILLDLIHILGYETSKLSATRIEDVKRQYLIDFEGSSSDIFKKIINSVQGEERRLSNMVKNKQLSNESNYIELIRKNIVFNRKQPFGVMVTATMSAGKSTFINSLIGKYVCLSQNMACTSKIHSIINKAFEDGYSSEYDYDLLMTADKEDLLNNSQRNMSNIIYVATNFIGTLSDTRIVVNDSPGVNYSGDQEHRKIATQFIKRRKYDLLIYVMNATQLGTNDEDEHLDYVRQTIGKTPIIFVMNKVDSFSPEEENVAEIIIRQIEYLKKKGFKNPIVCPISAKAGYLAKKYGQLQLSRSEERELYNYIDKFDKLKLPHYYEETLGIEQISDVKQEEKQLIKTCGLAYLEKIIVNYTKGGK